MVKETIDGVDMSIINTTPTSGDFGFFNRLSTTISPLTQSDTLDMTSGQTAALSNITGTATASLDYSFGSPYIYGYGLSYTFRVYGFKDINGVRHFTQNFLTSNTVIDSGSSGSYAYYVVDCDMSGGNTATFDGFRVLIQDDFGGHSFDVFLDTLTTNAEYDGYNVSSPVIVIPNTTFDTEFPILVNETKIGKSAEISVALDVGTTLDVGGLSTLIGGVFIPASERIIIGGNVTDSGSNQAKLNIEFNSTGLGNARFLNMFDPSATRTIAGGTRFGGFTFGDGTGGANEFAPNIIAFPVGPQRPSRFDSRIYEQDDVFNAQDVSVWLFEAAATNSTTGGLQQVTDRTCFQYRNRLYHFMDLGFFGDDHVHFPNDNEKVFRGASDDCFDTWNGSDWVFSTQGNGDFEFEQGNIIIDTSTQGIAWIMPTEAVQRFALKIGSAGTTGDADITALCNRASNGVVEIQANTSTGGAAGETRVARFEDDLITLYANTTITDAKDLILGATTGTKIGTATSQKLGFWNTTPIIQPTTGIAAATFVANTSGIVDDSATFDGYTIGQVVKALRNEGLLT